ncbi:MAG: hypothetical protein IPP42_06975 [Saprospiraceae bacterium]|nr:hypothetical protein [Saprospiraceae bacterium]
MNRPLRPVDDEIISDSSRIFYRNQINKLANTIKEIINGIKVQEKSGNTPENQDISTRPVPLKALLIHYLVP